MDESLTGAWNPSVCLPGPEDGGCPISGLSVCFSALLSDLTAVIRHVFTDISEHHDSDCVQSFNESSISPTTYLCRPRSWIQRSLSSLTFARSEGRGQRSGGWKSLIWIFRFYTDHEGHWVRIFVCVLRFITFPDMCLCSSFSFSRICVHGSYDSSLTLFNSAIFVYASSLAA